MPSLAGCTWRAAAARTAGGSVEKTPSICTQGSWPCELTGVQNQCLQYGRRRCGTWSAHPFLTSVFPHSAPHFPLCALRGLRARPRPPSARNLPPPSSGAQRRLCAAQSEDLSLFPQSPSTSAPPGRAGETAAPSVTQTASPGVPGLHHDPKSPVGPCVNSVRGHPEQPFSPTIHLPRFRTRLPWAEAQISALPASRHRQFSIRNFQSPISPPDHPPTLIPPSFLAVLHSSFHIRHSNFLLQFEKTSCARSYSRHVHQPNLPTVLLPTSNLSPCRLGSLLRKEN